MTNQSFNSMAAVLTVAGSDSGGGAGVQADLKTFATLGVFGTTAITCLTAQNPDEVAAIEAVAPDMVEAQIRAVCRGFQVAAAKTGMLYRADTIVRVAAIAREGLIPVWVVDPVMIATSGSRLLRDDAMQALCSELLPVATVATPNLPEAEALCEMSIRTASDLAAAARAIGERYHIACLAKGGHLAADTSGLAPGETLDVLWDGKNLHRFVGERVAAAATHGTGCTFSAALTAALAHGLALPAAARVAQRFVVQALKNAVSVGRHTPLNPKESTL